jgi:L-rhamnose mutarotase
MSRAVLTIDLNDAPDTVASYRFHHDRIWPEVAESLRRSGIVAMEIYLLGHRLVMIAETDGRDIADAFAAHHATASPRVAAWEALMKGMQAPVAEAGAGEWWARMERVFRLPDAP